jgi:hypothetical protein
MTKDSDLEEKRRNELGQQMVDGLKKIAELEQRPIKYFKANEKGVFCEVKLDSFDENIPTK